MQPTTEPKHAPPPGPPPAPPPPPPPHLHAPPPPLAPLPASNALQLHTEQPPQTTTTAPREDEPTTGVCPKCEAVCSSPKALERHLKEHHRRSHRRSRKKHGVHDSVGSRVVNALRWPFKARLPHGAKA
ncbi:hypothetical protein JCM6882_005958 [Rhodosporidiobolus microsporus]